MNSSSMKYKVPFSKKKVMEYLSLPYACGPVWAIFKIQLNIKNFIFRNTNIFLFIFKSQYIFSIY